MGNLAHRQPRNGHQKGALDDRNGTTGQPYWYVQLRRPEPCSGDPLHRAIRDQGDAGSGSLIGGKSKKAKVKSERSRTTARHKREDLQLCFGDRSFMPSRVKASVASNFSTTIAEIRNFGW